MYFTLMINYPCIQNSQLIHIKCVNCQEVDSHYNSIVLYILCFTKENNQRFIHSTVTILASHRGRVSNLSPHLLMTFVYQWQFTFEASSYLFAFSGFFRHKLFLSNSSLFFLFPHFFRGVSFGPQPKVEPETVEGRISLSGLTVTDVGKIDGPIPRESILKFQKMFFSKSQLTLILLLLRCAYV